MIAVCGISACAQEPASSSHAAKTGCCYFYDDYRWGNYSWEGKRYNPAEVWDDYHRNFGTYWQGQAGEIPQANQ